MFQPPIKVDFKFLPSYVAPEPEYVDFRIGETDYSGSGLLSGSYRIKDKPQKDIQVKVFAEDTNEYLGSTTTNEQGLFRVENLNKGESFYLVFREPNGLWEDRVSSRRKPV